MWPQYTAEESPENHISVSDNTLGSGRVLKAVHASAACWTVECYKERLIPCSLCITWQVKTEGGGGTERGLGLSNGASLLVTNGRWWGVIDLSGLMGTQWLTRLHATSFNTKPNGQAWSNPLPTNLFTPRYSWDYCPTCLPNHLPLATASDALWRSMPYTPHFHLSLKMCHRKESKNSNSKPAYLSWHNLKKKGTYLVSVSQEHKCTIHCC